MLNVGKSRATFLSAILGVVLSRAKPLSLRNNVQLSVSKHSKWRQNHCGNCLNSIHNFHKLSFMRLTNYLGCVCVRVCIRAPLSLASSHAWCVIVNEHRLWPKLIHGLMDGNKSMSLILYFPIIFFSLFFYLFIHDVRLSKCGGVNHMLKRPIFLFLCSTF